MVVQAHPIPTGQPDRLHIDQASTLSQRFSIDLRDKETRELITSTLSERIGDALFLHGSSETTSSTEFIDLFPAMGIVRSRSLEGIAEQFDEALRIYRALTDFKPLTKMEFEVNRDRGIITTFEVAVIGVLEEVEHRYELAGTLNDDEAGEDEFVLSSFVNGLPSAVDSHPVSPEDASAFLGAILGQTKDPKTPDGSIADRLRQLMNCTGCKTAVSSGIYKTGESLPELTVNLMREVTFKQNLARVAAYSIYLEETSTGKVGETTLPVSRNIHLQYSEVADPTFQGTLNLSMHDRDAKTTLQARDGYLDSLSAELRRDPKQLLDYLAHAAEMLVFSDFSE